jgi:hypothetical protein
MVSNVSCEETCSGREAEFCISDWFLFERKTERIGNK